MEDLLFRVGVSSLLIRLSGTSSSSLKSETQIVQHYNNYNYFRKIPTSWKWYFKLQSMFNDQSQI